MNKIEGMKNRDNDVDKLSTEKPENETINNSDSINHYNFKRRNYARSEIEDVAEISRERGK